MAKINKIIFFIFILIISSSFVLGQEVIGNDDFECEGFNCGTGWNNDWDISGTCSMTTLSSPQGDYMMRGTGNCIATRNYNNLDYGSSKISFWATATSLENGEYCRYYYYDGSNYQELLTLTNGQDDGDLRYYEYDVNPLNDNAGIRMVSPSSTGDYCYIDTITTYGELSVPSLNIFMDSQYPINSINSKIEMTTNLPDTEYTLELYDSSDNLFCTRTATSPSIPFTPFFVNCDMPSTEQLNARAYMYETSNPDNNKNRNFNVITPIKDSNKLKIEKVYFSPQVLQGGSTEIFVLLNKDQNLSLTNFYTELTFPDNTTRKLSMEQTINSNEYKTFITDTFRTGNTTFTIRVEADNYYDSYTNYYTIAPYNVNFVDLVDRVSEVLNVKTVESVKKLDITTMDIHGTEYLAGQKGKTFLQLLDGDSQPVTNSSCFTSIYYPNDVVWKYQQSMSYLGEGIYTYSFVVPYQSGVYPVSAFCTLPSLDIDEKDISDDFNSGSTSGGSNWATSWTQSGSGLCYYESGGWWGGVYEGAYSVECYNDRTFSRTFDSNSSYVTLDYSFFWRADDLEVGETVYYQIIDASSNVYTLLSVTDGDDDGVYHSETGTLSVTADSFDFDGTLTFQMTTASNLENTDYYNIDLLDITLNALIDVNTTAYQIVRGSGEIHVTTDNGEYYPILLFGELTNKSFEEDFSFHYDVISQTSQNKTGQKIELTLFKPFPCDHIINITERLTNGTLDLLEYSGSTDVLGRCVVNVEIDLNVGKTHDIEILSENYWKKQVYYDYSLALLQSEMINISCQNYILSNGLPNITIPLSTIPYGSDAMWLSCASYLDEYYHYTEVVQPFFALVNTNANFTLIEMEGIESLWRHKTDILHNLDTHASKIFDGLNLGSSYSLGLLTDPYPPTNPLYATYFASISTSYLNYASMQTIPTKVWNYSTRNLTEYPTSSVDINYTLISDDVWNYENRTLTQNISGGSVNINTTQLVVDVWNYTGTINDNILSQVATNIWEFTYRYIHGEDRS